MEEREIHIGKSWYYLGEGDMIHAIMVGEVDEKTAHRHSEAGLKILSMIEGPVNVLIDINKQGKLSPEARRAFKELAENEKAGKVAIFGLHPVARVLASFFMGTTKKRDIRFFKTKEEALAWLKE